MDYKKLYASKLCTAKEAVKDVTSGDWVDYGYLSYHDTDEFTILVDENYEEGMDIRKWEE